MSAKTHTCLCTHHGVGRAHTTQVRRKGPFFARKFEHVSYQRWEDANDTRINLKKIVNVVTGSLVLFPASLMHHTIPFESEEERIVLAFDVKQK